MSVLEQAASSNHIELVHLLLAKGAEVNTVDEGGFTALMAAAGNGDRNAAMVKLLIEHGAAVNVKERRHCRSCQERAYRDRPSDAVCKLSLFQFLLQEALVAIELLDSRLVAVRGARCLHGERSE